MTGFLNKACGEGRPLRRAWSPITPRLTCGSPHPTHTPTLSLCEASTGRHTDHLRRGGGSAVGDPLSFLRLPLASWAAASPSDGSQQQVAALLARRVAGAALARALSLSFSSHPRKQPAGLGGEELGESSESLVGVGQVLAVGSQPAR